MFRNYLKITIRNLLKNKTFSAINILGLAIGMAACLLILQYVSFERSYDTMHEDADRVYRVAMTKYEAEEKPQTFAFTYPAVAPHLKRDFPEVEDAIRIRFTGSSILKYEDKVFLDPIVFADSSTFKLFSFPVLKGDAQRALSEPYKAMISSSIAKKYFGDEDPIGKFIEVESRNTSFEVGGVFEDVPENSHIDFDILVSYVTYIQIVSAFGGDAENSWGWSDFYTYILLDEQADAMALQEKMPAFLEKYKGEDMERRVAVMPDSRDSRMTTSW